MKQKRHSLKDFVVKHPVASAAAFLSGFVLAAAFTHTFRCGRVKGYELATEHAWELFNCATKSGYVAIDESKLEAYMIELVKAGWIENHI